MAKSISARLGLTRWGAGPDTWSRTELDANFGQLEALVGVVRADTAANRGLPLRSLEFFVASDTGLVSFGRVAGGSWIDFGRLGSANTWAALGTFAAGLAITGGLTVDSITASKSIYGAHGLMSFTNEAARDAFYTGIGGIVGVALCYLSAPTGGGSAGLYIYNGTRWLPLRNYGMQIVLGTDWTIAQGVNAGGNDQGLINAWGAAPAGTADRTVLDNWDTTGGTFNRATGIWSVGISGRYRLSAFANCSIPAANNVAHSLMLAFAHRKAAGGGTGTAGWENLGGLNQFANTQVPANPVYNPFASVALPEFDVTLAAGDSVALTIAQLAGSYPATSNDKALAGGTARGGTYFRAELQTG